MNKYLLSIFGFTLFFMGTAQALNVSGHFADSSWAVTSSTYEDITVDMLIENDPGTSAYYYYANNAHFKNSGNNIYGGLQTNGHSGSKWVGKMAIFSIWNADKGISEPGGWGVKFGGEGVGYSVRIPYDWQAGVTYSFTMRLAENINGRDSLWEGVITNKSSGVQTSIGKIYAPDSWG